MSTRFVVVLLLVFFLEVEGSCPPETQCFGNGNYDSATQTCQCYARQRTGLYTGECCESIGCNANATCKHGYCGQDGLTCDRCLTGWTGPNCENVTSCYPWFPCKHGTCVKSPMKCDCDPGWVGDMCDRSLCKVKCIYGVCPNDPMKCECYENYYSPENGCDRSYCHRGFECLNGGYCIDLAHCVCPPNYSGVNCETISECSVPCTHGRCSHQPDICECERDWSGENCTVYTGLCLNCSSTGGTCEDGPNTCKCKPGYMGPQCSVQTCDGCEHGACDVTPLGKRCICDFGWYSQVHVAGFDPQHGPCNKIRYCVEPCKHGSCPNDPFKCECNSPYVGTECDTIQCPKCCPPQKCDCSDPNNIQCLPTWHHDCCQVKSCFRGDTLVHTAKGLVPIKSIKEGDMVVTRHEGDDPSVSYLRRVDQVRKRLVPAKDLVVFRMHDEDIWVTPDHPFFEIGKRSWLNAKDVTKSHSLHALKGKALKLKQHLTSSQLYTSSEAAGLVAVYDLSVDEYDRYSVGKDGLLVASCNDSNDLMTRDKQVWGEEAHPQFLSSLNDKEVHKDDSKYSSSEDESKNSSSSDPGVTSVAIVAGVLGAIVLLVVTIMIVRKYRNQKKYSRELEHLVCQT